MARVKFDVSSSDAEKASQSFETVKAGVYRGKLHKADVTKPSGKDRRIEAQYKISGPRHIGSLLFDYINLESEASTWKLDQFLQAFGVATKKKRKGEFDTDNLLGQDVMIRVKNEMYTDPKTKEARQTAKVAAVWAPTDEDEGLEPGDEDEPDVDEEDGEDEPEAEDEVEEETPDYSDWDLADLKAECKSRKIPVKGLKKSQLVAALEENDAEEPFSE